MQNRKARATAAPGKISLPSPRIISHQSKSTFVLSFVLAAATVALYSPVAGYMFVALDDHDYITGNAHIHSGLAWSTIRWAFTTFAAANWHPLTWISHAVDYQLFALNPAGHHLDSVLLHALNAVALFLLLNWVTRRSGPSLLVAALFAIHPLNVESVAWVSERKNVLSTLFFLLAIAAYVKYARQPDWRRYLLVAGLFAAGLMAKPMVITLPFVLLLLDYWPLERMGAHESALADTVQGVEFSRLVAEKIPLMALSAGSAWITMKAQRSGMAVRSLHQFLPSMRIENAVVSYGLYLWKMLWPARLGALYPHPAGALAAWQLILSTLVLISITVLVFLFRRKRYLPVGWFWFLGMLVPVIGLVQVGDAAMADRYAYVPLIGIFIIISFGLADVAGAKKIGMTWRVVPALCVLVAYSFVTHLQMSYWESDYDLWAHMLALDDNNPIAHDSIATSLLDPDTAMTANDFYGLDTEEKRMDVARGHYERALAIRRKLAQQNPAIYLPDMTSTLNNLANLDRRENRLDEARQLYEQALQIHRQLAQQNLEPYPPELALALNNLGFLERAEKRTDEAYPHFEEALGIYRQLARENPEDYLPGLALTLNNLAVCERDRNRLELSRQHYEEALKIRRQLAQQTSQDYLGEVAMTLNDLGNLDGMENRGDDARAHFEESSEIYRGLVRRDPERYLPYLAGTLNNLGFLDKNQNRIEESSARYEEALMLYTKLAETDSKYAGDVARVEAGLQEIKNSGVNKQVQRQKK
ncbi:MAG: tetratricopeptide repeat protein [Terriglobales bacterium]